MARSASHRGDRRTVDELTYKSDLSPSWGQSHIYAENPKGEPFELLFSGERREHITSLIVWAGLISNLNHHTIPHIHFLRQRDTSAELCLRLMRGTSLYTLMRERKLRRADVVAAFLQVAIALRTLHAQRVTYGNLSLQNIYLDPEGRAQLRSWVPPSPNTSFEIALTNELKRFQVCFYECVVGSSPPRFFRRTDSDVGHDPDEEQRQQAWQRWYREESARADLRDLDAASRLDTCALMLFDSYPKSADEIVQMLAPIVDASLAALLVDTAEALRARQAFIDLYRSRNEVLRSIDQLRKRLADWVLAHGSDFAASERDQQQLLELLTHTRGLAHDLDRVMSYRFRQVEEAPTADAEEETKSYQETSIYAPASLAQPTARASAPDEPTLSSRLALLIESWSARELNEETLDTINLDLLRLSSAEADERPRRPSSVLLPLFHPSQHNTSLRLVSGGHLSPQYEAEELAHPFSSLSSPLFPPQGAPHQGGAQGGAPSSAQRSVLGTPSASPSSASPLSAPYRSPLPQLDLPPLENETLFPVLPSVSAHDTRSFEPLPALNQSVYGVTPQKILWALYLTLFAIIAWHVLSSPSADRGGRPLEAPERPSQGPAHERGSGGAPHDLLNGGVSPLELVGAEGARATVTAAQGDPARAPGHASASASASAPPPSPPALSVARPASPAPPPAPAGMVAISGGLARWSVSEEALRQVATHCQFEPRVKATSAQPSLESCRAKLKKATDQVVQVTPPVPVEPFWIDALEVSRADYLKACERGVISCHRFDAEGDKGALPITDISFYDASDYCVAVGKRLPTEAEWLRAARGDSEAPYPWGSQPVTVSWNKFRANYLSPQKGSGELDGSRGAHAVSAPPAEGAYPFPVAHMGGNVREWVNVPSSRYPSVIRGGGWKSRVWELSFATRERPSKIHFKASDVGFRCAQSPPR